MLTIININTTVNIQPILKILFLSLFFLLTTKAETQIQSFQLQTIAPQDYQPTKYQQPAYDLIYKDIKHLQQLHSLPYQDTIIDKHVSIQVNERFEYESTVFSPVFVLDKQNCHSHQGSIEIQNIQTLNFHTNINSNQQKNKTKANKTIQPNLQFQSQNSFIFNKKYNLLYQFDSQRMKISAYKLRKQNQKSNANHSHSKRQQHINSQHSNVNDQHQKFSNNSELRFITSIEIQHVFPNLTNLQGLNCLKSAFIQLILTKSQDSLYVFTCRGVFMIRCQTVLSKVQVLMGFNQKSQNEVQRIFHGIEVESVNGYFFWLSQRQGIRIYGINLQQRLQYVNTIKIQQKQFETIKKLRAQYKLNNNTESKQILTQIAVNNLNQKEEDSLELSSIQYHSGLLYVLTKHNGILVYERQLGLQFKFVTYIDYEPEHNQKTNYKILIKDSVILIWTRIKKWEFITEIFIIDKSTNKTVNHKQNQPKSQAVKQSYILNRYYKGYRFINDIELVTQDQITKNAKRTLGNYNGKQELHNANINLEQKKHHIEYQDKVTKDSRVLLMILSQKGTEMFLVGEDVREISSMMNGVSNNHFGDDMLQILHLDQDLWLVETMSDKSIGVSELVSYYQTKQNLILPETVPNQFALIKISLKFPSIECKFQTEGIYKVIVQQQANYQIQRQKNKQSSIPTHQQQTSLFSSQLDNKISKHYHKPHLYHEITISVYSLQTHLPFYLSILSLLMLLGLIVILICWRQKKLNLIEKMVSQIRRINAAKRQQQHNPEYSIDKKWKQLKEQFMEEVSYKITDNNDNEDIPQRVGNLNELSYKVVDEQIGTDLQSHEQNQQHNEHNMSSQRRFNNMDKCYDLQGKNIRIYQ